MQKPPTHPLIRTLPPAVLDSKPVEPSCIRTTTNAV